MSALTTGRQAALAAGALVFLLPRWAGWDMGRWLGPLLLAFGFALGRWVSSRGLRRLGFFGSLGFWLWSMGPAAAAWKWGGGLLLVLGLTLGRRSRKSGFRAAGGSLEAEAGESTALSQGRGVPGLGAQPRSSEDALRDLLHAGVIAAGVKSLDLYVWEDGSDGPVFTLRVSSSAEKEETSWVEPALARRLIREMDMIQARDPRSGEAQLLVRVGDDGSPEGFMAVHAKEGESFPAPTKEKLTGYARLASDSLRAQKARAQAEEDRESWKSAMTVGRALSAYLEVDEIMEESLRVLMELGRAEAGYFVLLKKKRPEPGTIVARGYEASRIRRELGLHEDKAFLERLLVDREPRVLDPGPRGMPSLIDPDRGPPRKILMLPLHHEKGAMGFMKLDGFGDSSFAPTPMRIVKVLHPLLAVAVENARLHKELARSAATDPLTRLLNRAGFFHEGKARMIRDAARGNIASLAIVDLDHFKRVNDTWGHGEGDRVLAEAAGILAALVREEDLVGRWGGEEFVILFPTLSGAHAAKRMDQIREELEQRITVGQGKDVWKQTLSAGVATWRGGNPESGIESLVEAADKGLYKAKQTGRNRVVVVES